MKEPSASAPKICSPLIDGLVHPATESGRLQPEHRSFFFCFNLSQVSFFCCFLSQLRSRDRQNLCQKKMLLFQILFHQKNVYFLLLLWSRKRSKNVSTTMQQQQQQQQWQQQRWISVTPQVSLEATDGPKKIERLLPNSLLDQILSFGRFSDSMFLFVLIFHCSSDISALMSLNRKF